MQWHYIKKYMSQGVYTTYMESFIIVSKSAQLLDYVALLGEKQSM